MSIIASTTGQIENRIMDDDSFYSDSLLREIPNSLNSKYSNKSLDEIKNNIQSDINSSKGRLEALSKNPGSEWYFRLRAKYSQPLHFFTGAIKLVRR